MFEIALVLTLQFLLFFFLIRGAIAIYIGTKIKKNRHRTKRTKGQSLLDWLLYRRFSDVIPKSEMLYWIYYGNIALYVLLMLVAVVLNAVGLLDACGAEVIGFQLVSVFVFLFVAAERHGIFRKK